MVNVNALTLLLKYIEEKQLEKMKPWDKRFKRSGIACKKPNTFHFNLIKKVRKILTFISGGKIVEMLDGKILELFFCICSRFLICIIILHLKMY